MRTRPTQMGPWMVVMLAVAGSGCSAAQSPAGPAPLAADAVVSAAVATARAQHKVVLIEFGASWCTWCRKFQAFVNAPDVRGIIAANYVVTNLTVQERDEKKALENAGGDALMAKWNGAHAGLPFYVFLNGAGEKIGDSNGMPDGSNIGFPAKPDEVERFMIVLDKTASHLPARDRATVLHYLLETPAS